MGVTLYKLSVRGKSLVAKHGRTLKEVLTTFPAKLMPHINSAVLFLERCSPPSSRGTRARKGLPVLPQNFQRRVRSVSCHLSDPPY